MSMECCGRALIKHQGTGKTYTIDACRLDWESDGFQQERGMGTEIQHRATLEHPCLGQLVFEVWEYPEGVFNQNDHALHGHLLVKDFTYKFGGD